MTTARVVDLRSIDGDHKEIGIKVDRATTEIVDRVVEVWEREGADVTLDAVLSVLLRVSLAVILGGGPKAKETILQNIRCVVLALEHYDDDTAGHA